MKRLLSLPLALLTCFGFGQEVFLGLYMAGTKLGYASYAEASDTLNGRSVKRTDSTTVINAGLMGTAMSMKISSTSWFDLASKPLRMKFLIESGGRTQITDALFEGGSIKVTSDNSGNKSTKTLELPKDAPVLDDPILPMLGGGALAGAKKAYYVFDPMTLSLVKNTAVLRGQVKI